MAADAEPRRRRRLPRGAGRGGVPPSARLRPARHRGARSRRQGRARGVVRARASRWRNRRVAIALPWFALPAASGSDASQGWELISQADPDGRLRRVEARIIDSAIAAAPRSALLVDLSRMREADRRAGTGVATAGRARPGLPGRGQRRPRTLAATGHARPPGRPAPRRPPPAAPAHRAVRPAAALPAGALPAPDAGPQRPGARRSPRVSAELAAPKVAAPPQWLELRGRRSDGDGRTSFEFELDGRFPVQWVDVALPGNHAVEWRLQSRDGADADWRARGGAVDGLPGRCGRAQQPVRGAGIERPIRDRHWRLSADRPGQRRADAAAGISARGRGVPGRRLGRVLAGRRQARAERADSPVPQLVAVLRRQHGADWQPSPAYLGCAARRWPGPAALLPSRDWKAWLLWACSRWARCSWRASRSACCVRSPAPQPPAPDAPMPGLPGIAGRCADRPRGGQGSARGLSGSHARGFHPWPGPRQYAAWRVAAVLVPGVPVSIVRMSDLDLAGKRVLIREDLNVPIEHKDGEPAASPPSSASRPRCRR